MAAYISVPRDLTKVKSKVLFNLTKRQLLCFGGAALLGLPTYFLLKKLGDSTIATLGMMVIMLPLFLLAMYEKDGQPLEVVAKHYIQARFVRPKVRPYQTDNYYAALMRQYNTEKEVMSIVRRQQTEKQRPAAGKKKTGGRKARSKSQ